MKKVIPTTILSEVPFIATLDSQLADELLDSVIQGIVFPNPQNLDIRTDLSYYTGDGDEHLFLTEHIIKRLDQEFGHTYSIDNHQMFMIGKYEPGGFFESHTDFMNTDSEPNHTKVERDRIATILLYFNDDYKGGHTSFPLLDIDVAPEKGKMLYYEYNPLKHDLETNLKTTHEGGVVEGGNKVIGIQVFLEDINDR